VLMRNVRGSDTGVALMVTLGLLLFLLGLALTWWPATEPRALPEFFAGNSIKIGSVNVTWHELIEIGVAGAVAIGLRLLLFQTRTGIAMRGVVDDRDLTALNGGRPSRLSGLSWAIGSMLAATAGILLAPKLNLNVFVLTFLVIYGYAAAIVGQLKSLPLTFVGALVLGLAEAYAIGYLPQTGFWSHIKPNIPMLMLFAVLLFLPQVRLRVGRVVGSKSLRVPGGREVAIVGVVLVAATWFVASILSSGDLATFGQGIAAAIIMLSLVLLAGSGAADTVSMILRGSILQLATPDELRGRTTAVHMAFAMGGPQLGQLRGGLVAGLIGPVGAAVSGGLACVAIVLAIASLVPKVRLYRV